MGHLTVLYGSQTGCAEEFAERVGRVVEALGVSVDVMPMDSYDIRSLPKEEFAVFVVATAGQGEFPDNARYFWRFLLRKNLPSNSLVGMKAAVCGLGDSGYDEFNFAAKKLYRRLIQLGASFLVAPAYGDDQSPSGSCYCDLLIGLHIVLNRRKVPYRSSIPGCSSLLLLFLASFLLLNLSYRL